MNEFPEGKEAYCPQCYFEDEKVVLRKDCPGHTPREKELKQALDQGIQEILGHESIRAADAAITLQALRMGGKGYQGELIQVPLTKAMMALYELGKKHALDKDN